MRHFISLCQSLILFVLFGLSRIAFGQQADLSAGCGQRISLPTVIQWTWGLDGRFNSVSNQSSQLDFYDWALNKQASGSYVLARVKFDSYGVLDQAGAVAQIGEAATCISERLINFKNEALASQESISILLDYQHLFTPAPMPAFDVVGQAMANKTVARLQALDSTDQLYFMTVGFFEPQRFVTNDYTETYLPDRPSIISGGAAAGAGHGVPNYPLTGGKSHYPDTYIGALDSIGSARFAACVNDQSLEQSICMYGPSEQTTRIRENKVWQFDFIAIKPKGQSIQVPALSDHALPSVMVHRELAFSGTSEASLKQTVLCITGQYDGLNSYAAERITCPVQMATNHPLQPQQKTCHVLLDPEEQIVLGLDSETDEGTSKASRRVLFALECLGAGRNLPKNMQLSFLTLDSDSAAPNTPNNSIPFQLFHLATADYNHMCSTNEPRTTRQPLKIATAYSSSQIQRYFKQPEKLKNVYYSMMCAEMTPTSDEAGSEKIEFQVLLNYQ